MRPFSEKLNPRNELTRLGDIDFVGSVVDDVLTKTSTGYAFDAMSLAKMSDVVTTQGNLGLGDDVLQNSGATNAICIGEDSGSNTAQGTLTGDDFICIGNGVGPSQNIKSKSISIGSVEQNSGFSSATSENGIGYASVAIGTSCNGVANSTAKRGDLAVLIGGATAYNGCSSNCVCVGTMAGHNNPPEIGSVCVGYQSGIGISTSVKSYSVSVGASSNASSSGLEATGVGYQSHSEGDYSCAIGVRALSNGISAISVGAGARAQGVGSIGIGGRYNNGNDYGVLGAKAVVIGDGTALNGDVGDGSVVIGESGALSGTGSDNVVIGSFANSSPSTNNAICLNATGANLDAAPGGFVVKPIAVESNVSLENHANLATTESGFTHLLMFNPTSGEIRAVLQPTIA